MLVVDEGLAALQQLDKYGLRDIFRILFVARQRKRYPKHGVHMSLVNIKNLTLRKC